MIFRKNLSDKMKEEAVSLGLCAQWTAEWKDNSSKDEMVDKFVTGIDFCIKHNFPSTKVMKKDFGDVIHAHGVYVDENVRLTNPELVILNGCCVSNISYDMITAGEIYVRHDCTLSLYVRGMSFIVVNVYDNARVEVHTDEYSKCTVFQYGGEVIASEGVKVRDRKKFTFK